MELLENNSKNEDIVVFRSFRDAISANIVKSKLDAYGIPCFLTEENLSNLYPGASALMNMQIRLHLFRRDAEAAHQVLSESHLILQNDSILACPSCRSTDIVRDFPKHLHDSFWSSLRYQFFGIFTPERKVYHCENCGHEF
jgi:predicted RNA-binding Zn-ribbon protein involved in translation (DUF1610 family)